MSTVPTAGSEVSEALTTVMMAQNLRVGGLGDAQDEDVPRVRVIKLFAWSTFNQRLLTARGGNGMLRFVTVLDPENCIGAWGQVVDAARTDDRRPGHSMAYEKVKREGQGLMR